MLKLFFKDPVDTYEEKAEKYQAMSAISLEAKVAQHVGQHAGIRMDTHQYPSFIPLCI